MCTLYHVYIYGGHGVYMNAGLLGLFSGIESLRLNLIASFLGVINVKSSQVSCQVISRVAKCFFYTLCNLFSFVYETT